MWLYISVIFSSPCSENRNWSSLWGQMPAGRTESILKSYSCSNFPIYIVSVTPLDLRKCQIDKQMIIGPDDRPSLCIISYLSSQPIASFFSPWLAWLHLFYVPPHCDFAWNHFPLYRLWFLKIFKCSSFYISWFIGFYMQWFLIQQASADWELQKQFEDGTYLKSNAQVWELSLPSFFLALSQWRNCAASWQHV